MAQLIQLSRYQWIYLVAVLLVVLPLIWLGVNGQAIRNEYVLNTWAPTLQRDLGFRAALIKHPALACPTFTITSVTPNGRFARAGVRVGDIPSDGPAEFYSHLEDQRGGTAIVPLSRFTPNELHEAFMVGKQVEVVVPPRAN